MLVWKQLVGKLTQYKKDYLNRSFPSSIISSPTKTKKLAHVLSIFSTTRAQIDPSLQEFARDLAGAPGWLAHVA